MSGQTLSLKHILMLGHCTSRYVTTVTDILPYSCQTLKLHTLPLAYRFGDVDGRVTVCDVIRLIVWPRGNYHCGRKFISQSSRPDKHVSQSHQSAAAAALQGRIPPQASTGLVFRGRCLTQTSTQLTSEPLGNTHTGSLPRSGKEQSMTPQPVQHSLTFFHSCVCVCVCVCALSLCIR